MGVPNQDLPNWGGALGKLRKATESLARAIDGSGATNDRVTVKHDGLGALRIAGVDEDSQGGATATSSVESITIGKVTTGQPGANGQVVNSGTDEDMVLDFTLPVPRFYINNEGHLIAVYP